MIAGIGVLIAKIGIVITRIGDVIAACPVGRQAWKGPTLCRARWRPVHETRAVSQQSGPVTSHAPRSASGASSSCRPESDRSPMIAEMRRDLEAQVYDERSALAEYWEGAI